MEILAAANHPNLGACWNSNLTDVKDDSVKQSFDLLKRYIRNCHIHELYTSYSWREFLHLLRDSAYNRYMLAAIDESKDPEGVLQYYKALWQAYVL